MFVLLALIVCGFSYEIFAIPICKDDFDYECYVLRKLVDHMDAISSITDDLDGKLSGDAQCLDGWVPSQGSCYMFANQQMDFLESQTFCQNLGAHLVYVNSSNENNFIKDMLARFQDRNWWIGLTDEEIEGTWKLVGTDTSPEFTDWSPGEPNSAGSKVDEDCAGYYYKLSYRWVGIACSSKWSPICETRKKYNEILSQWVARVTKFSSQHNSDSFSANSVIGSPKVYPRYGGIEGTWAQGNRDDKQFIEVEFTEAVNVQSIDIFETYHAGGVVAIKGLDIRGNWTTLWKTDTPEVIRSSRIFSPKLYVKTSSCPTKNIRIEVDCSKSGSWVEIDAIQLHGKRPDESKDSE